MNLFSDDVKPSMNDRDVQASRSSDKELAQKRTKKFSLRNGGEALRAATPAKTCD
jgi:hypothetical protein